MNEDESPLSGGILVVAPHMDDETLGCGMLMTRHATKYAVHVLFATDGARSPERAGAVAPASGLAAVRETEAVHALTILGIPQANVEFLRFPDGSLEEHRPQLGAIVAERVATLRPSYVLVPFRYDRHRDHLAVNHAVTESVSAGRLNAQLLEYFVYTQWRLLRSGDVRDYLPAEDLLHVSSPAAAERKRRALACYRSQTTRYFDWQRRPILAETLIDRVCGEPETFLRHRPERNGRRGLARGRRWVPIACRLEPALKSWKDRVRGLAE